MKNRVKLRKREKNRVLRMSLDNFSKNILTNMVFYAIISEYKNEF